MAGCDPMGSATMVCGANAFPDETMAGAEAPASNGHSVDAVLVRNVGGGFSLREERAKWKHRVRVPQRDDGGR
jgi:hypothetical protein